MWGHRVSDARKRRRIPTILRFWSSQGRPVGRLHTCQSSDAEIEWRTWIKERSMTRELPMIAAIVAIALTAPIGRGTAEAHNGGTEAVFMAETFMAAIF